MSELDLLKKELIAGAIVVTLLIFWYVSTEIYKGVKKWRIEHQTNQRVEQAKREGALWRN